MEEMRLERQEELMKNDKEIWIFILTTSLLCLQIFLNFPLHIPYRILLYHHGCSYVDILTMLFPLPSVLFLPHFAWLIPTAP